MSNIENGISIEHFNRLSELLGLEVINESGELGLDRNVDCGRIISLDEFRSKSQSEKAERQKAIQRSGQMAEAIIGICRDYEAHMLSIAHQKTREEWETETEGDPYAQIDFDMTRLRGFIDALQIAFEEKGVATLGEAIVELEKWATNEVKSTIEYIFESDYFGFQCIAKLCQVGEIDAGQYQENTELLTEVQEDLVEAHYVFSIAPMQSLMVSEALAS